MTTATHNYGWLMPDPGGSANTWGNTLNGTTQAIDAEMQAINNQVRPNTIAVSRGPNGGAYGSLLYTNNGGAQIRWQLAETTEAESGGNAGSNFVMAAFDDTGAYIGNVFEVSRATQSVTFSQPVTLTGASTVTGEFTTLGGNIHVQAATSGSNPNVWFVRNDTTQMGVVYYAITAGSFYMQNEVGGGWLQINGSGDFIINGNALKPGGGAWFDASDARIKTVTGSYSTGLDQIAKLNPVKFRYKGNDGDAHALVKDKEFIGLVADEAMRAMPELVSLGEGEVDGRRVNDLKMLDPSAIIYALINAVKELKAEIEALKAGR